MKNVRLVTKEPKPIPGDRLVKELIKTVISEEHPTVNRVLRDCIQKMEASEEQYGSPLMSRNGRSADLDTYQDLIDAINYSHQRFLEAESPEVERKIVWECSLLVRVAISIRQRLVFVGVFDE